MIQRKRNYLVAASAIFTATIFSSPILAQQQPADLEALIGPSLEVDAGLQLARRQMADKDLLGAVGSLERVLLAHPEAVTPRLLYASILCRLDDRMGAEVELSQLSGQAITDESWAEVTAACGSIPRPIPPTKRGGRR